MRSIYTLVVPEDFRPCICDLAYWPTLGGWVLHRINVPEPARGLGYGTALLRRVLVDADREHVTLLLAPEPSGPLDMAALVAWYQRYGFTWTPSGAVLERFPQPVKHR